MASLSELRHIIRQQTSRPTELVRNLLGPVPATVGGASLVVDSTWLHLTIPGTKLIGLDQFYAAYSSDPERKSTILHAQTGITSVTNATGLVVLRGMAQLPGATNLPIQIVTEGGAGDFAVYANGVLVKQASGDKSFTIALEPGKTLLEIMVAATAFAVALPANVRIVAQADRLEAPIWHSITPYYQDPAAGTPANQLRWYNDARVGGWIVFRRSFVHLGLVDNTGPAGPDGTYVTTVGATIDNPDGDWTGVLTGQVPLASGFEPMGTVVSAFWDSTNSRTQVTMRLPAERADINDLWDGREASTGMLQEIARVQRGSPGLVVQYDDANVVVGEPYEYALQAYGLLDPSAVGPLSEIRYVRAGDTEPPGPILQASGGAAGFVADYPKVINGFITAKFVTPPDPDYAGVRVFYRDEAVSSTATGGTTTTLVDTTQSFTAELIGYVVEITAGTGQGQQYEITGVPNGTTLSIGTSTWFITPDSTSQYTVHTLTNTVTNYGLPNTTDQFTFEATGYGLLLFATFDRAGNVQRYVDAVAFDYTEEDDVFVGANQPPTVGFRQLRPDEQASYPAPYNDSINYALVELTARDPVDELVGVVIEYRRRETTLGTSTGTNSTTTLNDTGATWTIDEHKNYLVEIIAGTGAGQQRAIDYNTSNQIVIIEPWEVVPDATSQYRITWITGILASSVATTLDDPLGTRSRYVAINKTDTANWVTLRAYDQDGLYTEPISYAPDFDSIPEISSCEFRLDTVNDLVRVSGAVDDDTGSFEWWLEGAEGSEPTAAAPNQDFFDTTTQKAFPIENSGEATDIDFQFSLSDGTKKILVIRCWSEANFAGSTGPLFKKEIARSPRTVAVFESKDEAGNTSATTVRVTFSCSPDIPVVQSGDTLTSVDLANLEVTDSTQAWTPQQFAVIEEDYISYYLRVLNPDTDAEQFARIIDNTATTLVLETGFDPALGLPAASWEYEIWAGATFWRYGVAAATGPFKGISEIGHFLRNDSAPIYVEYFSVLSGVPGEAVQTALVDADTLPSFQSLVVDEVEPFLLQVQPEGPDDDVKSWASYASKGAPPVRSGVELPAGATEVEARLLDPLSKRFEGSISNEQEYRMNVGAGTWYVAACPINGLGQVGPCLLKSVVVDGTVTGPQLQEFAARLFDEDMGSGAGVYGEPAHTLLTWAHNSVISSPDTTYTMDIYGYREDLGIATEQLLASGRFPWQDSTSGDPPTGLYNQARNSDIDSSGTVLGKAYNTVGSYLHSMPLLRGDSVTPGCGQYRWVYRAVLKDGGVDVAQYGPITTAQQWFIRPIPQFDDSVPVLTQVRNPGAPSPTVDNKGNWYAKPPITLGVSWGIVPGTENTVDYHFYTEVAETPAPVESDYRFMARPYPGSPWVVQWNANIEAGAYENLLEVHTQYWTFRIKIVRTADNVVIDSRTTNTLSRVIGRIDPNNQPAL